MELESSLPLPHESVIGMYPEPDDTTLHPPIKFLYHLSIPPPRARSLKLSRCFRLSPHNRIGIFLPSRASYLSCSTHPPADAIFKWLKKQGDELKSLQLRAVRIRQTNGASLQGFEHCWELQLNIFTISVRSNCLCYLSRSVHPSILSALQPWVSLGLL
jgi:hypothetical protein